MSSIRKQRTTLIYLRVHEDMDPHRNSYCTRAPAGHTIIHTRMYGRATIVSVRVTTLKTKKVYDEPRVAYYIIHTCSRTGCDIFVYLLLITIIIITFTPVVPSRKIRLALPRRRGRNRVIIILRRGDPLVHFLIFFFSAVTRWYYHLTVCIGIYFYAHAPHPNRGNTRTMPGLVEFRGPADQC